MSRWTHALCEDCFAQRHPDAQGRRLVQPDNERCCYCGAETRSGLYDRNDPQHTPCLGRLTPVHRTDEEVS